MSNQDNIRIAEQSVTNLNKHDINVGTDLFDENYQFEGPGAQGSLNQEQSQAYIQGYFDAFPDLHFEVTNRIADGDYVVINWMGTGTHTAPMRTPTGNMIPATGKKCIVPGSTTYKIKDGKIVNGQWFWDMAALLAQLGLLQM